MSVCGVHSTEGILYSLKEDQTEDRRCVCCCLLTELLAQTFKSLWKSSKNHRCMYKFKI